MRSSGIAFFVCGCLTGLALAHLNLISTAKSDQTMEDMPAYHRNAAQIACWKAEQANLDEPIGDADRAIIVWRIYDCLLGALTTQFANGLANELFSTTSFRSRADEIARLHSEFVMDLWTDTGDRNTYGAFNLLERATAATDYMDLLFVELELLEE